MRTRAAEKPRSVENPRPIKTFCQPCHRSTSGPAAASPAPLSPAMRAWLSLVGRPSRQAKVLQTMMDSIAAATTERSMTSGLMMPLPTVKATAVPVTNAPARLSTAAIATACCGVKTRVATTVAMALGASVQPLTNSAASTRTSTTTSASMPSGILQGHSLKYVGHVFAAVGGAFQMFVNLAPFQDHDQVRGVAEQLSQGGPVHPVRLVLQPIEFDAVGQHLVQFGLVAQYGEGPLNHQCRLLYYLGQFLCPGGGSGHLVQQHGIRCRLDEVQNIVQGVDQGGDVLAVQWRDEGAMEMLDYLVRDGIASVFDIGDGASFYLGIAPIIKHAHQGFTGLHQIHRVLL